MHVDKCDVSDCKGKQATDDLRCVEYRLRRHEPIMHNCAPDRLSDCCSANPLIQFSQAFKGVTYIGARHRMFTAANIVAKMFA